MIERFNFYDIYGYFIPGFLLLFFLWLPHAVVARQLPADVGLAVLAVIIAYVTGHVLQAVAHKIVPSKRAVRGADGKIGYRYPSDYLFDQADGTFTAEQKTRISGKILSNFGVSDPPKAFLSCRGALIASKATSYAEQFQGMYVLMRGICAASVVGGSYIVGGLWHRFVSQRIASIVMLILVVAIASIFRYELPKEKALSSTIFAVLLTATTVCGGILIGPINDSGMLPLSLTAVVLLLVALWTFGAYQAFAEQFAKTVYLDFDLLDVYPPKSA